MVGEFNQPSRVLTRTQLTAALVLVTLIPFGLVVVLYTTLPDRDDPVLVAKVAVEPRPWPNDKAIDARIVPCVVLENPTDETWNNVSMSVNEQFHFYHPDPVPPGGKIIVPLKFFQTKGSRPYPPESQELKLLTIYARIPSGARAILEVDGAELMPAT